METKEKETQKRFAHEPMEPDALSMKLVIEKETKTLANVFRHKEESDKMRLESFREIMNKVLDAKKATPEQKESALKIAQLCMDGFDQEGGIAKWPNDELFLFAKLLVSYYFRPYMLETIQNSMENATSHRISMPFMFALAANLEKGTFTDELGKWSKHQLTALRLLYPDGFEDAGNTMKGWAFKHAEGLVEGHAMLDLLASKGTIEIGKGQELATKLGAAADKRIAMVSPSRGYLNFDYAINAIGEQSTTVLYLELGIEYFARYSKKTLEAVTRTVNGEADLEKPIMVVVASKNDWNGVLYSIEPELGRLAEHYRLVITEIETEDKFYSSLKNIHNRFGEIGGLVIMGHGTPEEIVLGNKNNNESKLDITDEKRLRQIKNLFAMEPVFVLVSCSTGKDEKGIGALLSSVFGGGRTFAPSEPFGIAKFIFGKTGIADVQYDAPAAEFLNGTIRRKLPEFDE